MKRATIVCMFLLGVVLLVSLRFLGDGASASHVPVVEKQQAVSNDSERASAIGAVDAPPERSEATPASFSQEAEAPVVLCSPLEALRTYRIDMRTTEAEPKGLSSWLNAMGGAMNDTPLRATMAPRWGLDARYEFPADSRACIGFYQHMMDRAAPLQIDVHGVMREFIAEEESPQLLQHWLDLSALSRSVENPLQDRDLVRRLFDTMDRQAKNAGERLGVLAKWLITHDPEWSRNQQSFLSSLFDPAIGKSFGDACGFNLLLICNQMDYAAAADLIPRFLAHPSPEVQWGAVGLLRQYVSRGQLGHEELGAMIPDALVRSADGVRAASAIEILASLGGENGREKLLSVARDPTAPRSGTALSFLAVVGKVSTAEVLVIARNPGSEKHAVVALGVLAGKGDEAARRELNRYLDDPRPDMRQLAEANGARRL